MDVLLCPGFLGRRSLEEELFFELCNEKRECQEEEIKKNL